MIRWFGASETALRFPSVVLSLLTILMVHRLGRLLFDEATGLLAATIVALSVFHVSYAREARSYALMVLLSTASYYFFAAWPIHRRRRDLVGYVLATTILPVHALVRRLGGAHAESLCPRRLDVVSTATSVACAGMARHAGGRRGPLRRLGADHAPTPVDRQRGILDPSPSWSRLRYLAGLYGPRWAWAVFGVALISQSSRLFAARPGSVAMLGIWFTTTVALPTVASFYFVPML